MSKISLRMNPSGIAQKVESYGEYISRIRVPILDIYKVPSRGSRNKLTHVYIREEHRANFKYLVDYVCGLHRKGKSLECIAEPSLIFEDGNLQICGVGIVKGSSYSDRCRDFKLLAHVLENLLRDYNPQNYKSPSFNDLIRMLKHPSFFEYMYRSYEDLLQNHLALVPHEESVERIKKFSENSSFIHDPIDQDNYKFAVEDLCRGGFNKDDWTQWYRDEYPELGPATDCFNFKPKGMSYNGTGPVGVVNADMLRFCRNMATHLHQHMGKHTRSKCGKKDVDLTIMALFETELLSFQWLTFEYGISKYFIPGSNNISSTSSSAGYAGQDSGRSSAGQQRQASTPIPSYGTSLRRPSWS